jgi:hypothetical protein
LSNLGQIHLQSHNKLIAARIRRQFEGRSGPQIDLNITVPYIFSARLYPYGLSKGDQITHLDPQPLDLHTPLQFLGGLYQTLFASFELNKQIIG